MYFPRVLVSLRVVLTFIHGHVFVWEPIGESFRGISFVMSVGSTDFVPSSRAARAGSVRSRFLGKNDSGCFKRATVGGVFLQCFTCQHMLEVTLRHMSHVTEATTWWPGHCFGTPQAMNTSPVGGFSTSLAWIHRVVQGCFVGVLFFRKGVLF